MHENGDKYATSTGAITIEVSAESLYDEQVSKGNTTTTINIKDDISFIERMLNFLQKYGIKLLIAMAVLLLILGYIPPFKKYVEASKKKADNL